MGKEENLARRNKKLGSLQKEWHEFSEGCKNLAKARRKISPIQVELMPKYMSIIEEYVERKKKEQKPATIAGICLACGIGSDTYYACERGDYDYIVEEYMATHNLDEPYFVDENGEVQPIIDPSKVFGMVALLIQEQLEENIYTNKGNPAGSIFGLKARYQWKEDEPQTVNNTLVIANSEQAKKAMKLLND